MSTISGEVCPACGYNVSPSSGEYAHLYFTELGNISAYYPNNVPRPGTYRVDWGLVNTGPFTNLQDSFYWSSTQRGTSSDAWAFAFSSGYQGHILVTQSWYALAVLPGDVAAVPVPAAVWLFSSGLLGLLGVARRRKAV